MTRQAVIVKIEKIIRALLERTVLDGWVWDVYNAGGGYKHQAENGILQIEDREFRIHNNANVAVITVSVDECPAVHDLFTTVRRMTLEPEQLLDAVAAEVGDPEWDPAP